MQEKHRTCHLNERSLIVSITIENKTTERLMSWFSIKQETMNKTRYFETRKRTIYATLLNFITS